MKPARHLSPLLRELHQATLLARAPLFADALRAFGLTLEGCPLWGVASVDADETFYQPDEEGILSAIVPAYEDVRGRPTIVDLVACNFATREMRTRKGVATVLGHDLIENACLGCETLNVYDNALTWLRGKCRGVVIVDWQAASDLLRDVPGLCCESPATAQRLAAAFERPRPYPPILVHNGEKR